MRGFIDIGTVVAILGIWAGLMLLFACFTPIKKQLTYRDGYISGQLDMAQGLIDMRKK